MELLFAWDSISKAQSVELQSFTCTEGWPRTPHGRKLPKHPCEWEWAAQRHVRNLGHHLRAGDSALVGRDQSGAIRAALRVLQFGMRAPPSRRTCWKENSHRSTQPADRQAGQD